MKAVLFIILCMNLISCGKKKNESGTFADLQKLMSVDSDFDGIGDIDEKRLGTDPLVANIPAINIETKNVTLQGGDFEINYTQMESSSDRLRRRINQQVRHSLKKINYKLSKDFFFSNDIQIGCLLDDVYMKFLGEEKISEKLNLEYSFSLEGNKFIRSFSNIYTDLLQLDEVILSGKDRSEVAFTSISFEKKIPRCINLKVIDFKFVIDSRSIEYSDVLESVKEKLSHIIIKNGDQIIKYSVKPQGSFLDQLSKNNLAYKLNYNGDLINVDHKKNTFSLRDDFESYSHLDPQQKRWFFLSSNRKPTTSLLEAGESYILAFTSIRDILIKQSRYEVEENDSDDNSIDLTDLKVGDHLLLKVDAAVNLEARPPVNRVSGGYIDSVKTFIRVKRYWVKNGCVNTQTNIFDESRINKLLNQLNLVAIFPSGNKVIGEKNGAVYHFKYEITKEDLVSKKIKVKLEPPNLEDFRYTRQMTTRDFGQVTKQFIYRCKFRVATNITTRVQEDFKIKYKLETLAVRRR